MFKRYKFLFLSVLVHLIVIYVVAQSVMFPSVVDSPPKKPNIIQATLIFDLPPLPPKEPVAVIEELKPLPVEPEKVIPIAETPKDSQIEFVAESKIEEKTPQVSPPQPQQNEENPEDSEQNNRIIETMATDKNIASNARLNIRDPATTLARRHLKNFRRQQQSKMAKQASRHYQKHKDSPEINTELQDPFMTEDEKIMDNLKVRADCSSTSKKTTAVLLGFLGAQIDCSTPPPINSFIQDRINKKSLLPAQQQPADKKRPQSVVFNK